MIRYPKRSASPVVILMCRRSHISNLRSLGNPVLQITNEAPRWSRTTLDHRKGKENLTHSVSSRSLPRGTRSHHHRSRWSQRRNDEPRVRSMTRELALVMISANPKEALTNQVNLAVSRPRSKQSRALEMTTSKRISYNPARIKDLTNDTQATSKMIASLRASPRINKHQLPS